MKEIKTDAKKYSLTGIETQLLKVTQQNLQAIMSNEMAMIAIQRLGYEVTANTRFVFSDDMTEVAISEDTPEAEVING